MAQNSQKEIFFEFRPLGAQMRVAAIDSETGIEVVIVAPRSASENEVKRIAAAKLMRKLDQDRAEPTRADVRGVDRSI